MVPLLRRIPSLVDLRCSIVGRCGYGILLADYQNLFDIEGDLLRQHELLPEFSSVMVNMYSDTRVSSTSRAFRLR